MTFSRKMLTLASLLFLVSVATSAPANAPKLKDDNVGGQTSAGASDSQWAGDGASAVAGATNGVAEIGAGNLAATGGGEYTGSSLQGSACPNCAGGSAVSVAEQGGAAITAEAAGAVAEGGGPVYAGTNTGGTTSVGGGTWTDAAGGVGSSKKA